MKKIHIGELIVQSYKQDEIIDWLDSTCCNLVKDLEDAILSKDMGYVGVVAAELKVARDVIRSLNKNINGKTEPVVL